MTELGDFEGKAFRPEIVEQAIKNIAERANSGGGRLQIVIPSTTHNYVKFAPQNIDQLIHLHNLGYDLYDVPLDREVTTQGEYYQDPAIPSGSITYQYTLVPANYSLPTTVPYTLLGQVLLFDETAGDEADEPDPWEVDPTSGYCYDEYGQPYICGTNPRIYLRLAGEKRPEDLYMKATQALIDAGFDLIEVYNEMMRLAGMNDEILDNPKKGGRTQDYTPKGIVKVKDDMTGLDVPVKNLTIKTRRFF